MSFEDFNSPHVIRAIKQKLDDDGIYFGEMLKNEKDINKILFDFVSRIGTPSEHNLGEKDYIWTIKAKERSTSLGTFSENNHTAPLHTDSQYRSLPERFILMYSVKPANCGGGNSYFLDVKNVWEDLKKELGYKGFSNLFKLHMPFAIPDAFCKPNNSAGFITAPVLTPPHCIRYRKDTLLAGLALCPNLKTQGRSELIETFDHIIHNKFIITTKRLEQNQFIIFDNHRYLHGRDSFTDLSRRLLRIRFNL